MLIDVEDLRRPTIVPKAIPANHTVRRTLNLYASTGKFYGEHGPAFSPSSGRGVYSIPPLVYVSSFPVYIPSWGMGVYLDGYDYISRARNREVRGTDHTSIMTIPGAEGEKPNPLLERIIRKYLEQHQPK